MLTDLQAAERVQVTLFGDSASMMRHSDTRPPRH
jgi:hypothetical protein